MCTHVRCPWESPKSEGKSLKKRGLVAWGHFGCTNSVSGKFYFQGCSRTRWSGFVKLLAICSCRSAVLVGRPVEEVKDVDSYRAHLPERSVQASDLCTEFTEISPAMVVKVAASGGMELLSTEENSKAEYRYVTVRGKSISLIILGFFLLLESVFMRLVGKWRWSILANRWVASAAFGVYFLSASNEPGW